MKSSKSIYCSVSSSSRIHKLQDHFRMADAWIIEMPGAKDNDSRDNLHSGLSQQSAIYL